MPKRPFTRSFCSVPPKQILTGLPADGLVVQTDDPTLAFGNNDTAVQAVDACSGLEVAVVS